MTTSTILRCFLVSVFAITGCSNSKVATRQPATSGLTSNILKKEKWHWNHPQKQNDSAGYAQVVKAGNMIYVSGVATDDVSPKGIANVYKALGQCLKTFGATPQNIVKETLYTTDIETMKKHNEARKSFYKGDFPAATWVQISRLYEPGAWLEVDIVAQLPEVGK
ncbi:RidA family protein [Chitinophaga sp. NPDC101104]|uniref:RidA family protein n=1 Tax=Chitinophaga sp. NPDC101104 TaxID=3390561 RepID=UPI003D062988